MGTFVFDKTSEHNLKEAFQSKMPAKWRRFRSCMCKVMDQYYFKELPPHELQKQLATAVTMLEGIHSMDDASAFMSD
jgi:hypothetical protein